MSRLLYLDQNYLSGIAKHKPGFVALEPVLRDAVARGDVAVVESAVHERESHPRPDLGLLELLRGLSGGHRLPDRPDQAARDARRRMARTIELEFPKRHGALATPPTSTRSRSRWCAATWSRATRSWPT